MRLAKALQDMPVDELVGRFAAIALDQYEPTLYNETNKYNRLYKQMSDVSDELKSRAGDQRRALMPLLEHPNVQVRLAAAHATLALAYTEARSVIQAIADSSEFPQAFHAGMSLSNLDRGIYKPV